MTEGLHWQDDAACRQTDPEAFFPGQGESAAVARKVCREHCPVRGECLSLALDTRPASGIWGGLSLREVDRIARGTRPWPADIPRPGRSGDGREVAA